MQIAFYFIGILGFLIDIIFFSIKCIEWREKRIANKYQTNQHHFISDLYKLQIKWAGAGEIGYAESVGNLIKLHGLVPKEAKKEILTNDGQVRDLQLNNNIKESIKGHIEEIMTEFID